jgi:glycosyltransferase involved in cell wall biosynthesis
VVAYASSAVPETLGDGGVLLPAKDGATVAAAVDRVLGERDAVVAAGADRLRAFDLEHTRAQWVDLLQTAELCGSSGASAQTIRTVRGGGGGGGVSV